MSRISGKNKLTSCLSDNALYSFVL